MGGKRMRLYLTVAAGIAIAGGGGAGCGGSGTGGSTTAKNINAVRPTQLPPGGLGSYIRAAVPKGDSTALDLTGDGRYSQSFAGHPSSIRGVWRYRNGKATFAEVSGSGAACIGKFGTYSWRFSGGKLTLRVLADPCGPRKRDFSFGPWTKGG